MQGAVTGTRDSPMDKTNKVHTLMGLIFEQWKTEENYRVQYNNVSEGNKQVDIIENNGGWWRRCEGGLS